MIKKIYLLPSILILSAGTAQADGLYISGKVGASTLGHTIERNIGTTTLPVQDTSGVSSVTETGVSLGIGVGYTFDINEMLFVGGEAFYNYENASTRNINSVLVTDIDLEHTYGGRFIAGAHVTDKFSLYAHAGATVLDFDINNSYTFAPPVREASSHEVAFSYGLGADYKLDDNVSVFAEFTQIKDVGFTPIPEVAGGTGRINPNDLDLGRISLGVKYSF